MITSLSIRIGTALSGTRGRFVWLLELVTSNEASEAVAIPMIAVYVNIYAIKGQAVFTDVHVFSIDNISNHSVPKPGLIILS